MPTGSPKFSLYDNVLAKWTDGKWYSAQIFQVLREGRYSVYFIGDDEVLDVKEIKLKFPTSDPIWARLKRDQFINRTFKHTNGKDSWSGAPNGTYIVQQLGHGEDVNKYVLCTLMGEQGEDKEYLFHMGYVQNIVNYDRY